MPAIGESQVLIMATNRFEESELFGPREILIEKGAEVTLASPTRDEIMATVHDEPGKTITPDLTIDRGAARRIMTRCCCRRGRQSRPAADERGGDRADPGVRRRRASRSPRSAMAPWLLVEADVLRGRRATAGRRSAPTFATPARLSSMRPQ